MAIEIKVPKKLIEVALPLDSINIAAAYEKMPGIGPHPRGVHHWWARRPMAAARAIIFAQLVNDPGFERGLKRGVNRKSAEIERKRLLDIVSRLADWKNSNDQELMREAYNEILKSWKETRELNKKHPEYNKYFSEESPCLNRSIRGRRSDTVRSIQTRLNIVCFRFKSGCSFN